MTILRRSFAPLFLSRNPIRPLSISTYTPTAMKKFHPRSLMTPRVLAAVSATALSITAFNSAHAGEMFIYKDKSSGQVLLTNVDNPTGGFSKFTQKVKVTYYPDSKALTGASGSNNSSYGSSSPSGSATRNAYDALIRASASRHGIDPGLMKAMMHTESAFNPNARSPVGAQGLMQLMPATARRFSVGNPWNPADNIEGSAKYIAWLLKRFNNNVEYAVAGYNAGEGNVDKYKGIPPFRETRNYVKSVMSRYHSLYKNDSGLLAGSSNTPTATTNYNNNYNGYSAQPVSYATVSNGGQISSGSSSYTKSAYEALR